MTDSTPIRRDPPWVSEARANNRNRCANCGGTHKLAVYLIVPAEAGGLEIASNATLLCRACKLAQGAVQQNPDASSPHLINLWASRALHTWLTTQTRFRSASALARYLMELYLHRPETFDDLAFYQEAGADVRVNVWVEKPVYDAFKAKVTSEGLTVTDALKNLLRMYQCEAEPQIEDSSST